MTDADERPIPRRATLAHYVALIGLTVLGVVLWLFVQGGHPKGPPGPVGSPGSPGPKSVVTLPPVTPSPFTLLVPPGQTATITTSPTPRPSSSPRPTGRPSPRPTPSRTPTPSPTPTRTPLVCIVRPIRLC